MDLYQILGYVGSEVITKLPSIVNKLKLSSLLVLEDFRTYKACRLIKAYYIILREPSNKILVTYPL